MCSRYELNSTPAELGRAFRLKSPPARAPLAEVRPTDPAPVVTVEGEAPLLRWGLVVDWSPRPLINARCESLASRPTFRPLLHRRCLVPATAWFEWRKEGKAKLRNRLRLAEEPILALAGLCADDRFVIVTRPALPEVAHIHDRMPVVIPPEHWHDWLNPDLPEAEIKALLMEDPGPVKTVEDSPRPRQASLL